MDTNQAYATLGYGVQTINTPQGTFYLTNLIPSFPYGGPQIVIDPSAQPFLSYNPLALTTDGLQPVYTGTIVPSAPLNFEEEVEELEVENAEDGDDAECRVIPRRCAHIPKPLLYAGMALPPILITLAIVLIVILRQLHHQ